jgi:hypothetical protein
MKQPGRREQNGNRLNHSTVFAQRQQSFYGLAGKKSNRISHGPPTPVSDRVPGIWNVRYPRAP